MATAGSQQGGGAATNTTAATASPVVAAQQQPQQQQQPQIIQLQPAQMVGAVAPNPGGIQIVQQIVGPNGEVQQIPIQLTSQQLQMIRTQMTGRGSLKVANLWDLFLHFIISHRCPTTAAGHPDRPHSGHRHPRQPSPAESDPAAAGAAGLHTATAGIGGAGRILYVFFRLLFPLYTI